MTVAEIKVTRRTGEQTNLDITKIRKVVEWACNGLDINPIALESGLTARLRNGITTREIQDNLINCALEMCNIDEPDWRYVAGRLLMWNLWKDTEVSRGFGYGNYVLLTDKFLLEGKYDERLYSYTQHELKIANSWINPQYDLDYDFAGATLLTSRYLLPDELPQEAFLTCALLLAMNEDKTERLTYAKAFYEAIAQRKISLATPILANLRVPNGSLTSCFIIAMDDNLESIYREITNTARISKNGGGVGVNVSRIRATGSRVMGKNNASGGVIPWVKLLNDTAIAVNQGGRRAGAVTVGLDIWHLDVPEFLEMQTENGDQRRKAYDVFPQLVIPDEFMRRVDNKTEWTLVDPYEVKEKLGYDLASLWGAEFEKAYQHIESSLDSVIRLYKKVSARDLFKHIMRSQVETGMPYLAFKDTINRANPNKHDGYIPQTNLCVAPETYVLTDKGHFEIQSLANQWVNVWNGSEWSNVYIKKTGENQKLITVNFSNGESLTCTRYHKFWVQNNYRLNPELKLADELETGDKLIKYLLPVISNETEKELLYAYTSGCFAGDGSYGAKNYPKIDLYGEKKNLLPHIAVRNKLWGCKTMVRELNEIAVFDDVKQDRLVCKLPLDLPSKTFVPLHNYSLSSRLQWLAGLLDTDGTVGKNGTNESLSISSVNKPFLLQVRLMLQTLGVDSKVTKSQDAKTRLFPDGKGGQKEYFCQTSYRLLINSNGLYQLSQLGLKTHRLKWTERKPQREASQFVQVVSVEDNDRIDDTYCFTEPKKHLGMFNGILTGQCTESYSNVTSGNTAHCCNLVSLNLANIEANEFEHICRIAVRILDNTIDITNPPFEDAKNHNNRYRTIGVGAMGLADWLAKHKLRYENLTAVSNLFEDMGYYCTKASMELAKTRGSFDAYQGSDWQKGLLIGSKPVQWFTDNAYDAQRWQSLANDIQTHGIRNSHITAIAPNTSSSLVQGCTASILPVYSRFFYDKWAKGTVPIAPPFIKDGYWYYQENKNLNQQVVVNATATIQQWIDTGISMELIFNLNEGVYYPDEPGKALTAKDIFEVQFSAWQRGVKAIYYTRTVQKDNFKEECVSCAN